MNGGYVKRMFCLMMVLFPACVFAAETATVCHNELSEWIRTKRPLAIVDLQHATDFRAHNYDHSLGAGTDPARLKKIATQLKNKNGRVVVVSSNGGDDASRAVEQMVSNGVQRHRMYILEGGMAAAAKNAACDCCKPASTKDPFK